ncbi:MAG TPA: prepilin-type N-terminal cleavage/methylation domain-containing protein [Chthoniobacterales bacterium]
MRAPGSFRAYTLIEIMLVLALIAIMFLGAAPLVSASMRERRLRSAAEDIEGMVRDQRLQALTAGERRVLRIEPTGFYDKGKKHKLVLASQKSELMSVRLPGSDWSDPDGQDWEFSPIGMVTPLSVRLKEGPSWIEVDFDLLTGRVADERYAF